MELNEMTEVLANEEITNVAIEDVAANAPKIDALKVVKGVVVVGAVGFLAYKYIIKPLHEKRKAKKAQEAAEANEDSDFADEE